MPTATATAYSLTAPYGGIVGQAGQPLIVAPNGSYNGTITVAYSGAGLSGNHVFTFASNTPQTLALTPTAAGTLVLTPSNNGSLTDPPSWRYAVAAAPTYREFFSVVSGFAAGLATVGYTVVRPDGSVYQISGVNRNTFGITEAAAGTYNARIPLPTTGQFIVRWDDGTGAGGQTADDVVAPSGVEPGFTVEQVLSLILAEAANKSSGNVGVGTSNSVFTATDGSTTRLSGTSDVFGNRTPTLNPPV